MDWDLTSYFPEFGGLIYNAYKADLSESIETLNQQIDDFLEKQDTVRTKEWEPVFLDFESILMRYSHISSYLSCLVSANAANEDYLQEEAHLAELQATISKLVDRIIRSVGNMSDSVFSELVNRSRLRDTEFLLNEYRKQAQQRMSGELEGLAADLNVNGLSAWSRLYFTTMGNLKFRYSDPEKGDTAVPMAQLNSLLSSSRRDRRIAAYEGAAKTFEEHEQTYAAALNAISGTRLTLNKHRGINGFLDVTLQQSRMDKATLDALMAAVEEKVSFGRSVFQFRNEYLGIEDPGYVDLRAPLPIDDDGGPPWKQAVSLVSDAFNSAYPALGAFFDELVDKNWIDYTPRENKRPGGFCSSSMATRESRIFMTYKDTLNDVMTLAHEAGHAWHTRVLKNARPLASRYPMPLAESASTFAERILAEGIVGDDRFSNDMKLVLLDAEVEHMLAFLLDLPVRFKFEKAVYGERAKGVLSPKGFCSLMEKTQREVFGDSLSPGREDPWFWASKLHFYIDGIQFYNYPYTFGYLLSTAYFNQLKDNVDGALNTYERFLENSGRMSCEDLVEKTLGEDIRQPEFWASLIDQLSRPFEKYKELLKDSVS